MIVQLLSIYSLIVLLSGNEQTSHFLIVVHILVVVFSTFILLVLQRMRFRKRESLFRQHLTQLIDGQSVDNYKIDDYLFPVEIYENLVSLVKENQNLKQELENFENLKRGYYNTMINGLVVHERMKLLDVNVAIGDMTGYKEEELKSLTLDRILIPHESISTGFDDDNHKLYYRSMCFSKSGEKFPVDVQMSYLNIRGQKFQISVIRDLREKREIEEELQSERARRTKAMFDGQEMERRRLAKEIHDGLGQSLIAIRLIIEGKIAGSTGVNKEALEKIRSLIDRTISDARLMSNNLMPSVLHEFGLVTALRQLCDHVRQSSRIEVDFDVEYSKFMLSTLQTVYLFRIAQEAINNILKHSMATKMRVFIEQSESELFLNISDNGKGIDLKKMTQNSGNGLYNIRERVQLLKGKFEFQSEPSKGTSIHIIVPNWRLVANE